MVFDHEDIKDKWKKCPHRIETFCKINMRYLETPIAIVSNCGNCMANQKEPNIF